MIIEYTIYGPQSHKLENWKKKIDIPQKTTLQEFKEMIIKEKLYL